MKTCPTGFARMNRMTLALLCLLFAHVANAEEPRQGLDFFEAKIRPMLVTHCYECHSAGAAAKKNLKAGLLLDSREGSRKGGESGPAVVPGKVDESLLMAALNHESFEMPPKGKLPDEIIADFRKWIELGAPDPRDGAALVASSEIDIEAGRKHWAFQPLENPTLPEVQDVDWIRNPIDRFVRAQQEAKGITPNAIASPRTLIRRAYFDLIGLPPEPEEVDEYVAEAEQDPIGAYTRMIDRLLESDHYGERWARHWLDISRFAESHGYAFDGDRPNAWHYRDFVIRAFNSDMPYDEFVRLQIAGDLLTDSNVKTSEEAKLAIDRIAATGFLVAGPFTTQQTQKERERSRYEQLDDVVSTLGTSMLGLTVGCSRCHSHKFDPLPQYDYYRLVACFADVGSSQTAINNKPVEFQQAKAAFDAAHAPRVAARTKYEQEQLPGRFEQWLVARSAQVAPLDDASLVFEPWHHVGPFAGETFDKAYDDVFEPEKAQDLAASYGENLKWTARPEWKDGVVHNTLLGDNSANYLFRVFESAEDQEMTLSLGSDDAIKVWVNSKEVLANKIGRGAAPGQETVQVPVTKGRNTLLLKIVNGGGPSGFYFSASPAKATTLPGISPWTHIGPFVGGDYASVFAKPFPPELEIDLAKAYEEDKLKWVEQPEWVDGVAYNDKLTGNNCANYLYRTLESAQPQTVSLSLGSDDGIKLWVNGREVLSKSNARNVAAAAQETVVVQLAAGRNEILLKIVNGGGKTGFYFAASATSSPSDVNDIFKQPAEKRDDKQKARLVDWHKGFDLEWLHLNQVVVRHAVNDPKPNLTNVFSARARGTTYQFGEDTYKVYHLRRGNADNKQDEAKPGFLQVLMRADEAEKQWLSTEAEDNVRPGRIGLANWLTDVENGSGQLLARVIVNRMWYHHFGRGIVATPSDFGTRGEAPSHPELLDWLARELIRNEWRLKPIHKLIMTSGVYMQGGAGGTVSESAQHDPENLLLWRRSARRLEAEVIRDSLLAASGTLDRAMFGKGTLDQNSTRRSIYFTVKRSQLIPLLKLFDAPDAMQGIAKREESTVAPQALALLNSPVVGNLATKLATRIRPDANISIDVAIDRAYQVVFSRNVSTDELQVMVDFVQRQKMSRGNDATAETLAIRDFCHLLLCMNEFVYVD